MGATEVFSQGETPRAMGFPQVEQVAWEPPEVWIGGSLRSNFSPQRAGSLIASVQELS
ncbi:hypothetical protein [Nostoc sp.]|uniref:hypothetical protein n=1 Tax=Nostoc sp. TaxID=1180 RepID=UPI002FF7E5A2